MFFQSPACKNKGISDPHAFFPLLRPISTKERSVGLKEVAFQLGLKAFVSQ